MSYSSEYHKAYYQRNKERIQARRREFEKNNPEVIAKWKANSAPKVRDPEKAKAATAAWEERNREAVLLRAAKNRAARDGVEFSLDLSDIVIPDMCPLLEIPIVRRRGGHGPCDNSPSLDRIDNSKGYVKGNVWVISWLANKMKATATFEQMRTFARNVEARFG